MLCFSSKLRSGSDLAFSVSPKPKLGLVFQFKSGGFSNNNF